MQDYAQLHQIVAFQQQVRNALLSSPVEWLSDESDSYLDPDFFFQFDRKGEYPRFSLDTVEWADHIKTPAETL